MKLMFIVAYFLVLLNFIFCADPTVDVNIKTGSVDATIRGYQHSYGTSFRGIRYAQAPLGSLRFKEAQRLDPSGLFEALAYGKPCVQGDGSTSSEDCLFINVYSPNNVTSASMLPVYVYFHGGGFIEGSGNMGAGIYPNLVNKGSIVMVSLNYRMGPFGFFSTRDAMAPGNWAISDWIEALNWVQRYIKFFGGDPSRVTIGGQSSGAEAVSTLTLSPVAKSLYKQSIFESGSAFGAAVMSYSEKTRYTSQQLSISLNCATQEQWTSGQYFGPILNCLRGLTYDKIVAADNKLPNHRMKWSIVLDKTYLPERLEYLALKRDSNQNVLMGDVHDEWLGWELYNVEHNINTTHNTGTQMKRDLTDSYEMKYWDNQASVQVAANNWYINNKFDDNDHRDWEAQRIQLWSEMVFIGPVLRDASYFAYTKSNVYLYSLDWLSPNALPQITDPKFRGCQHSWELQYIFSTTCSGFDCTGEDELLRNYFTTTWLNFIKTGNPTPAGSSLPFKWLPLDTKTNRFLSFTPYPKMQMNYHPDSSFWVCTAPTIDGYKAPFC